VKIAFIDASAAIRWILGAADSFREFGSWKRAGGSVLFEVACRRAFLRMLYDKRLTDGQYVAAIGQLEDLMESIDAIPLSRHILERAQAEFIYPIKTLDAIHVTTAHFWQQDLGATVTLVSHDDRMNLIAKSLGLKTLESK
jgi:predicted nucleic acid-binding protein